MLTPAKLIESASYGAHGDGAEIAYSIVDSTFGRLIVAGTTRGVGFAGLGDCDRILVEELHIDFPRAKIRADASHCRNWTDSVVHYLAGQAPIPDLPLDVRGTRFQILVWDQLRAIPEGETRSYSEIAQRIERPRAVRAVGTANGANPVAILIPCHRAIRQSGHLGGYRWGLERKRKLLDLEARRESSADASRLGTLR